MLFRVIYCVNNVPYYTPTLTLDQLRKDNITARTAHLIQYIDVGEVFTIVMVEEGDRTYLVIRIA